MTAETDRGYILRVHALTDTSLVVRWLTAVHGRVATVARGARQAKSPFAGRLDLFFDAEMNFQRSRQSELHALREVNVVRTFPSLRADYTRLAQASYAVALVEMVTEVETPVPEIHGLFGEFLGHLETGLAQPRSVYALEVRMLAAGGLDPVVAGNESAPSVRDLLVALRDLDWASLPSLQPGGGEIRSVRHLIAAQFEETWGRLPRGRTEALATVG